jgi:iron(III) transport system ATP-binding protein
VGIETEHDDSGPSAEPATPAAGAAGPARVSVSGLNVGYRPHVAVLHDVSIEIEPRETVSLLGPSGCGKTTLLRAIAGLQRPFSGEIRINGKMVDGPGVHVEPHHRRVGMVFQDGALFPHLNVAQNVGFGLRNHEAPDRRVAELLELVELESYADRLPDTLSGGQRQRVALARALAPNPAVLLLDEPFSALDAAMRNQIRRDVKRILQQIGITTIVVTHDQDEAFVFGDRVALMREGELVQVGRSTELYDRPLDRWVADFVGEVNVVSGTLTSAQSNGDGRPGWMAVTDFGTLPAIVIGGEPQGAFSDAPVDVLIRPEQLDVAAVPTIESEASTSHPEESGRQEPAFVGSIESAEYFGHDVLYQVATADRMLAVRSADSSLLSGDRVEVRFRGRNVVAWPEAAGLNR